MAELTPKQARFVEEYLVDLNAKQAAIRAGYAPNTAQEQGSRLLSKAQVQEAVAEAQAARSQRTQITQDRVLQELAWMGFANLGNYIRTQGDGSAVVDLSAMTMEQSAALQEVTVDEYTDGRGEDARDVKRVKVKMVDKKGSLELIGRHLGMWNDKMALGGDRNNPLQVIVKKYSELAADE